MALDVRALVCRYPWLWHVTTLGNAQRITRSRRIEPAAALLRSAGRTDLLNVRRRRSEPLRIGTDEVHLRDQAPLHDGHVAWEDGWDLARFVSALNERVFFWPGNLERPTAAAGPNAPEFLRGTDAVAVLVPSAAMLLQPTSSFVVEFSRFNTGGPRTTGGAKSPRGSSTFLRSESWTLPLSRVREVAVVGPVDLSACWSDVQLLSGLSDAPNGIKKNGVA